jgi:hypothetical protein
MLRFGFLVFLRAFLFYLTPSLTSTLLGRVEVSTPFTSFVKCKCPLSLGTTDGVTGSQERETTVQECLFLHDKGLEAYESNVCHQVRCHPSP